MHKSKLVRHHVPCEETTFKLGDIVTVSNKVDLRNQCYIRGIEHDNADKLFLVANVDYSRNPNDSEYYIYTITRGSHSLEIVGNLLTLSDVVKQ
jgi:hypothetical protein